VFHACLAIAITATVLALAGSASALSPRPSGRIYYAGPAEACAADESLCAPRDGIWSIAPDGHGSRFEASFVRIPMLNGEAVDPPTISHNGRLFAFAAQPAPTSPIAHRGPLLYVVAKAGGSPRLIASQPGFSFQPRWSPSDRWIAFLNVPCCGTKRTSIWVVSAAGGTPRRVAYVTIPGTFGGYQASDYDGPYPDWSPDGQWIEFPRQVKARGPFELWAVHVSGKGLHQVTHLGLRGTYYTPPATTCPGCPTVLTSAPTFMWTPNARLVVWTSGGIFIADRRLRRVTRIAGPGGYNPVVSPLGHALLFTRDTTKNGSAYRGVADDSAIYRVGIDGRNRQRLTAGANFDQAPAWSPDGRWFSFSRDETLWVESAAGGAPIEVPHQAVPNALGYGPVNARSAWLP
jgi:Tol biopolymer transport system component